MKPINVDEQTAKMRALLDAYSIGMKAGHPDRARDAAYEMTIMLGGLYGAAYASAELAARGEGKAL